MKYVLELLRGNTTYNSRSEAITALDSYPSHRAGQPVVVIYKKNGNSRALLAIGTGPQSYTIIGDADGSIDITSKISARDIVLDEIDYSGLLDDLEEKTGHHRFGWLGTDKDPWKSTEKIPSGTTVQEAFEAILVGRAQEPEPEPEPITYTVIYKCEGQDDYIDSSTGTIPALKTAISEWNLLSGQTIKEWKNSSGDTIETISEEMFTVENNYQIELTAVLNILELTVNLDAHVETVYDGESHSYEDAVIEAAKSTIIFKNSDSAEVPLDDSVYSVYITGWNDSAPDVREFKDASDEAYSWTRVKVLIKEDYDHLYNLNNSTFDSSVKVNKATLNVSASVIGSFTEEKTVGDIKNSTTLSITGKQGEDNISASDFNKECYLSGESSPLADNVQLIAGQTYIIKPGILSNISVTGSVYDNYTITYIPATLTVEEAPLTVTSTTGNYGVEENEDGKYTSESDIILAYDYFNDPDKKTQAINSWDSIIQYNDNVSELTYDFVSAGINDMNSTYLFLLNNRKDKVDLNTFTTLEAKPTTIKINRSINEDDYQLYIFNSFNESWTEWQNGMDNSTLESTDSYSEIIIDLTSEYTNIYAIKLNNI